MKRSFALVGAAAQCVLGLGLDAPAPSPTDPAVDSIDLYGISPKPTTLARFHPDLAKRQTGQSLLGYLGPDNTCGYVSGLLGASKTCDSTQQCAAVLIGTIATMGCCDNGDCTWYGNCVNSAEYYISSQCDEGCMQDVNTVKCTEVAYPYCYPYMVPGVSIGWFSCDSITRSGFAQFLTTFTGESDGRTWSKLYDTASGASSKIKTSAAGSANAFKSVVIVDGGSASASASGSSKAAASSSSSKTGTISNKSTKSTPIGAIVGGIIGGLVVLGLVVGAVIIILMKRKRGGNQNRNIPTTPAVVAATATNGAAPPPGPDMRQSMYGQQPQFQPQGPYPQQGQYPQQQQFDPQNPNGANAGFFAAVPIKHDQNTYAAKEGPTVTEQAIPMSPQPPTSPAPPYVQPVQQGHESWNQTPISPPTQSPPPGMMNGGFQQPQQPAELGGYQQQPQQFQQPQQQQFQQPQQPQGPPPQFQQAQQPQGPPPAELGTNFGVPSRNQEGRPVYEAA